MKRVHFYNGGLIRRAITEDAFADALRPYIERPQHWETWATVLFELNAWDSLYDRTGALPHPLRIENLRPMPKPDAGFRETLDALCLERAHAIASRGQQVRIFWSGGIDSTLVVTSFLRAAVPHDQLELLFTADSVKEYPAFLDAHVPPAVRRTEVKTFPHHNFVPDADAEAYRALPCMGDLLVAPWLNVTGGLGDKLFNSHQLLTRYGYANALKPYRDVISPRLAQAISPLVAACPLPVRTLYDFTWWVYFALNFQDELLQMLAGVSGDSVATHRDALCVFFDTDGFQQWSMHHRDRLANASPERLKHDAKLLIHAHTKDDDYLKNKRKAGSLKFRKTPNVSWDNPILLLLEDGAIVRAYG